MSAQRQTWLGPVPNRLPRSEQLAKENTAKSRYIKLSGSPKKIGHQVGNASFQDIPVYCQHRRNRIGRSGPVKQASERMVGKHYRPERLVEPNSIRQCANEQIIGRNLVLPEPGIFGDTWESIERGAKNTHFAMGLRPLRLAPSKWAPGPRSSRSFFKTREGPKAEFRSTHCRAGTGNQRGHGSAEARICSGFSCSSP